MAHLARRQREDGQAWPIKLQGWDAVTFAPVTGAIGVDSDQRPPRITTLKYHWQLIQQQVAEFLV